jgi:hypothetical protein
VTDRARAPALRVEVEALAAKLRKPVTRACPKTPGVDAEAILDRVVERVLAARAARRPGDSLGSGEQWRIAWRTTADAVEDLLHAPADRAAIPEPDRLWAAARRDLRSAELDRLDRRASRDVALRERLAIARVFAEQAALDEEETVDAQRMVISGGDLPEELEDLDASTDRRGLLRVAAAIAVLAAVITLVALALR